MQMHVNDKHDIPKSVRIIAYFGFILCPKLKRIKKRCKEKLYQISKITRYKDFNLTPRAVWKLYITTIRPIIEYGMMAYCDKNI